MPHNNLNILVLLREVSDPRPPANVMTRGAGISERGLRRVPNPADLAALEEALCLKDMVGAPSGSPSPWERIGESASGTTVWQGVTPWPTPDAFPGSWPFSPLPSSSPATG